MMYLLSQNKEVKEEELLRMWERFVASDGLQLDFPYKTLESLRANGLVRETADGYAIVSFDDYLSRLRREREKKMSFEEVKKQHTYVSEWIVYFIVIILGTKVGILLSPTDFLFIASFLLLLVFQGYCRRFEDTILLRSLEFEDWLRGSVSDLKAKIKARGEKIRIYIEDKTLDLKEKFARKENPSITDNSK
jgi:hypothetical protein